MDKLKEFIKDHPWTVLLVVIGLIVAILLVTIGFFKTLLIAVIVGVAFYIGRALDRNGGADIKNKVSDLFSKKDKGANK